jgi:hypothetical protein
MAVALGDFQNDGRLGVFVTNISKSGYLFQGTTSGSTASPTVAGSRTSPKGSWRTAAGRGARSSAT